MKLRTLDRDFTVTNTSPQTAFRAMTTPKHKSPEKWGGVFKVLANIALIIMFWPVTGAMIWMGHILTTSTASVNPAESVPSSAVYLRSAEAFYSTTASDEQNLDSLLADLINNVGAAK